VAQIENVKTFITSMVTKDGGVLLHN